MSTRKSLLLYVGVPTLGFIVGSLIVYGMTPETTPQHTTNVSGSSGELICDKSCTINNNQ